MMSNESPIEFTRLWTRAQPGVLAYISATVRNFSDAEDLLQNVAVTAVRKFSDYDPEKPFIGWVIGIARLEILRYLRSHARDRHQFVDDEMLALLAGACERNIVVMERERAALAHCLQKLSGRLRELIDRRYGDGMKTSQIAAATGLKPAYISVGLNRAYQQLRQCIDHQIKLETAE